MNDSFTSKYGDLMIKGVLFGITIAMIPLVAWLVKLSINALVIKLSSLLLFSL